MKLNKLILPLMALITLNLEATNISLLSFENFKENSVSVGLSSVRTESSTFNPNNVIENKFQDNVNLEFSVKGSFYDTNPGLSSFVILNGNINSDSSSDINSLSLNIGQSISSNAGIFSAMLGLKQLSENKSTDIESDIAFTYFLPQISNKIEFGIAASYSKLIDGNTKDYYSNHKYMISAPIVYKLSDSLNVNFVYSISKSYYTENETNLKSEEKNNHIHVGLNYLF